MSVKVRADSLRAVLKDMETPAITRRVGERIVEEIKKSIEIGFSPVEGERRFVEYKKPYPVGLKPSRPVNLYLTGKMLGALEYFFKGSRLWIGIRDGKEKIKAQAHNDGLGNVPERHFLPTREGEVFNVRIMRELRDLYAEILSDTIRRNR